jgi:hypothetical protein
MTIALPRDYRMGLIAKTGSPPRPMGTTSENSASTAVGTTATNFVATLRMICPNERPPDVALRRQFRLLHEADCAVSARTTPEDDPPRSTHVSVVPDVRVEPHLARIASGGAF